LFKELQGITSYTLLRAEQRTTDTVFFIFFLQMTSETPIVKKYKAIVTDIEGTTTPITFVKDVLFPYILANLQEFLERKWKEPSIQKALKDLYDLSKRDAEEMNDAAIPIINPEENEPSLSIPTILKNVEWQMSIDRKIGPLKSFQGLMWEDAYKSGSIKGIVYEDVIELLKWWDKENIPVYIYSSGSIFAQKLLFGYSEHGNLLHLFAGHFDTTIGLKTSAESYKNISNEINFDPQDILFLTDNILGMKIAYLRMSCCQYCWFSGS
jgi:enolase-phosphatase E1